MDELIDGQQKTLLMLIENQNPYLEEILNKFSHFITDKLLFKLIPLAARTKFGPEAMKLILQSQCFKGYFFERVTKAGLISKNNSFDSFF